MASIRIGGDGANVAEQLTGWPLKDAVGQPIARVFDIVNEQTGEPATASVETVGRMADGTEVSRFVFTWSFKTRTRRS